MWQAEIIFQARKDIEKTVIWYNERKVGLGKLFLDHLSADVSIIQLNPYAFALKYQVVRSKVMTTFPYMIHYFIDAKNHKFIIIAVFHTKLNPSNWKKRI